LASSFGNTEAWLSMPVRTAAVPWQIFARAGNFAHNPAQADLPKTVGATGFILASA
jgi:hypothetical protein